jgi:hypothetical protein
MKADPDPHGQAALMLMESLLLLLVEEGVLLKEQMIDNIDGVIEVKQEIAGTSESVVVSLASIGLLRAVSASLSAAAGPKPQSIV